MKDKPIEYLSPDDKAMEYPMSHVARLAVEEALKHWPDEEFEQGFVISARDIYSVAFRAEESTHSGALTMH